MSKVASAGPYDAPANYYDTATGTGNTLKSQLHNIIDGHSVRSYGDARSILQITDQDPNDPDRVILVYDRVSINVSVINPNGSIPGWDSAATWNREHTWPRSRGVNSSGPDDSDLHQLRPSTTQVNSARGNLNFGGEFGAQGFGTVVDQGSLKWYPGDADAGLIARQQFYVATRYDGSDSATEDLELVNGNPGINGNTLGDLNRLIEWHYAAPPDEFELRRNDVIFDDYQGNRNPFIDRPEFVWSVFVDQQNDSQISIAGATVNSNGSSSLDLNLGRVLVGAPLPSAQQVIINKFGNDGTYYDLATTGSVTTSISSDYHAFRTGGVDSQAVDLGLSGTTAVAGLISGTVTIDNLDVTNQGGVGRGANDRDDTIALSVDVLAHANPSLAADSDLDSLTFDFGTFTQGSAVPTLGFDIYNLESTAGFTAGLALDQVLASGDTNAFQQDFDSFIQDGLIGAGSGMAFEIELDTSVTGSFNALYQLSFSDEDLPGAVDVGTIDIFLSGIIESATVESADFDIDSDIDGADFLTWQNGHSTGSTLAEGDANGDLVVDELDFAIWEQQYGILSGGLVANASAAEPIAEPSSFLLSMVAVASCFQANYRRRGRKWEYDLKI